MKIIYNTSETFRSGEIERALAGKANWLAEHGHDVLVVTTDQRGRDPFFSLAEGVRCIDLGIDYETNDVGSFLKKLMYYPFKQLRHKRALRALLSNEGADVVVSTFCDEVGLLTSIKDGSMKVLDIHFPTTKRIQYSSKGICALADKFRSWHDVRIASRYDKFVVLTEEDRKLWRELSNICVIPNASPFEGVEPSNLTGHHVISVGRLCYQKSYDRLINAGCIVKQQAPGWVLDSGELQGELQAQIDRLASASIANADTFTTEAVMQKWMDVFKDLCEQERTNVLFIVNPISGKRHGLNIQRYVEDNLDHSSYSYVIEFTRYPGHATELAKNTNASIVVAVGGDGTVNEVARGLIGTSKSLAIVPTGSGNGFAAHLGIPRDSSKSIRTINHKQMAMSDCCTANGHLFLCTCGVGLDAEISHAFAKGKHRGLLNYVYQTIKIGLTYSPKSYNISFDSSKSIDVNAILITVGNANQWGNGFYICPHASIEDGLLDITILHPFPLVKSFGVVWHLLHKDLDKCKYVSMYQAKSVSIGGENGMLAHYDGDPFVVGRSFNINLIEDKMSVIKNS